mmetsp:Transcript_104876/g.335894  ORF Transcript_104876/g.335894 Transcript_104876/m.335894 type:complete len:104 (+) Transcript_104876:83-394(+)
MRWYGSSRGGTDHRDGWRDHQCGRQARSPGSQVDSDLAPLRLARRSTVAVIRLRGAKESASRVKIDDQDASLGEEESFDKIGKELSEAQGGLEPADRCAAAVE